MPRHVFDVPAFPTQPSPFGKRRFLAFLLAGLGVWACGESAGPTPIQETRAVADLNILELDQAPILVADSVSFYAVRGQDRSVEMWFADSLGQSSERLMRFEVGASSLSRDPSGRKFQTGDSVLITIRIADSASLAFDFQPSGLEFKSNAPAELTVAYGRALTQTPAPSNPTPSNHDDDDDDDDDDDGTGAADDDDPAAENDLGVWVQEQTNNPYTRLTSRLDTILNEIVGEIPGFSKYAVAY